MKMTARIIPILTIIFLLAGCNDYSSSLPVNSPGGTITATMTVSYLPPTETSAPVATPSVSPGPESVRSHTPAITATGQAATPTGSALAYKGYSSFVNAVPFDGRWVLFSSISDQLVVNDTNQKMDVFLYDRETGTVRLVSVSSDGSQANDHSFGESLSPDGRYAAFRSTANNLVAGDSGQSEGLFLHDQQTGQTKKINLPGVAGVRDVSIAQDGNWLAFIADAMQNKPGCSWGPEPKINPCSSIYLFDRERGNIKQVSIDMDGGQANGPSFAPVMTADGRYIAFKSFASNLVKGDEATCPSGHPDLGCGDIFIFDRVSHTLKKVVALGEPFGVGVGQRTLDISENGNFIVFQSVDFQSSQSSIQVFDRDTQKIEQICAIKAEACNGYAPQISGDGRWVAFSNEQVYLYDRNNKQLSIASQTSDSKKSGDGISGVILRVEGLEGNLRMSGFGRWVAFASQASNLLPDNTKKDTCSDPAMGDYPCYDIFLHNRETGETKWVNKPIREKR